MSLSKVLYVDVPFEGEKGGDKNRSQFLWKTLCNHYDVDLLLLLGDEYRTRPIKRDKNDRIVHSLVIRSANLFNPRAIHYFHQYQIEKFKKVLKETRYDLVFFRFLSCFELASIAHQVLPNARIAIDVDMLFSRISELSWKEDRSIHNRYHLFEMIKLRRYELMAFRSDFLFFFTNSIERDLAVKRYGLHVDNALVNPNMMPATKDIQESVKPPVERFILFFGSLDSVANIDAFEYLKSQIYSSIETELMNHDCYILVVGKGKLKLHENHNCSRMIVVGEVDDMASYIALSQFVILPLRIASGTRTRILESASQAKAVITTSIGKESLDFDNEELMVCDTSTSFAEAIVNSLNSDSMCKEYGMKLERRALSLYTHEAVANKLISDLEHSVSNRNTNILSDGGVPTPATHFRIAVVSNRFYPEVGGAETNIYYQTRMLAQTNSVTVFCPKRDATSHSGSIDGVFVNRLLDLLAIGKPSPNMQAKTLCPTLLYHLVKGKFDMIQCFPALNYNNILAFIAAKIMKKPFILCFFDFIDYAGVIKDKGGIDPNILSSVKPPFYQRYILRKMDYAYAIANKEIEFLKRFNPNVEYSPVPILLQEYDIELTDPRKAMNINEDDFLFLCLGRVSQVKGQDIVLKAFVELSKDYPSAKLIFVGRTDYEPEFYNDLLSVVINNNLEDRVIFTGMLDRKDVLSWLKYSDIHVIPVRFMNSGAVVVESWVSGTPVIQSDVVDPNLVIDGVNGYVFKSEDSHDCAQKMEKSILEKMNLSDLADQGKQIVLEKYTYEYLIDLYQKTYIKLSNP